MNTIESNAAITGIVAIGLLCAGCRSDRSGQTSHPSPGVVSSFPFYIPDEVKSVLPSSGATEEGAQVAYTLSRVDASQYIEDFSGRMSEKGFRPLIYRLYFPRSERGWARVSDTAEVWTGNWVNEKSEGVTLIIERQQGRNELMINQSYRIPNFMKPWLERYGKYHVLPSFGATASRPESVEREGTPPAAASHP